MKWSYNKVVIVQRTNLLMVRSVEQTKALELPQNLFGSCYHALNEWDKDDEDCAGALETCHTENAKEDITDGLFKVGGLIV